MTISVVIPAYNEEKYLPKTLEAIRQLSRKPDELIVVDGGSTDKTASIARMCGATVVTIPHRGIGFARQKGLEAAMGNIVAWTDADTIVPRDWLDKIVNVLLRPGVAGTYGPYYVDGGWFPYRFGINRIQPLLMVFLNAIGLPLAPGQNTAYFRDKALAVGGYPIDFQQAEDLEMARRLRTVGKVILNFRNPVRSSSRRGEERWTFFTRMARSLFRYYITHKANTIGFPDIR